MVILWTLTSWNSLHSLTKDPMRARASPVADFTLLRKERTKTRHSERKQREYFKS